MSKLMPFSFEKKSIRIVNIIGELWFVAADIATVLLYRDASNLVRLLDDDERSTHIVSTPSGEQEMIIINESGLYSAIFLSRKSEAKRFKKWVTSKVLPAIRKTGQYVVTKETPEARKRARHMASASFKMMMEMLKLSRERQGKKCLRHHYTNEARLINQKVSGEFKALDREQLSLEELDKLAELEVRNALLIGMAQPYALRKQTLDRYLPCPKAALKVGVAV